MKSIKEKELLVNFAKSLGQDVDPTLVEEVEQINSIRTRVKNSVQENVLSDLFKALAELPKQEPVLETTVLVEEEYYPKPPSLDDLMQLLEEEVKDELVQTHPTEESPVVTEEKLPDSSPDGIEEPREETLADKAAKLISEAPKSSYQQPDPIIVPSDIDAIRGKLKFLEQWLSKVSLAGPGGGAGSVAKLDHETKLVSSDTYSVTTKDYYIGINYAGPVTITLPTIINDGKMYIIKDESGHCSSNPITVLGNVDNDPGGFILAQDNGGIQLIYRNGWRIV
jgi:hypothetical protein